MSAHRRLRSIGDGAVLDGDRRIRARESTDLGDLANRTIDRWNDTGLLPSSLVELRSSLFFEQRRHRHMDMEPEGGDMVYIRALVEAIRDHAQSPIRPASDSSR